MGLFNLFRRKKRDDEAERRALLLRAGRITEGTVAEVGADVEGGEITRILYSYVVNSVEYQSWQTLDPEQRQQQANYLPDSRVTIRYDPKHPGNSIVI
ncbi:MAG: hypothetical protein WCB68_21795 [Pyrinomonadaceae bacterium]